MIPDQKIRLPGTTGKSEVVSPIRNIRLVRLSAVYSIQVI
jgi:hypothetical protein